jgi:hypothetical protein
MILARRFQSPPLCGCLSIVLSVVLISAWAPRAVSAPPPLRPAGQLHLGIPRAALGQPYLMSMSLIPQAGAATSRGLTGKVVQFEVFHDAVDLYETTEGMVVTEDLPARLLLASFPIVEQDKDRIVIDFNRGMRRVFTQGMVCHLARLQPDRRRAGRGGAGGAGL